MSRRKPVNQFPGKASQTGISLIELLVSLLLGMFLSAGIVVTYLESKRNYAAEEEMARIQENGRFSLNLLKREMMLAGFFGGYLAPEEIATSSVNTDCAATDWALSASNAIELTNNHSATSSPQTNVGTTLTCLAGTEIQPGTDVLTVKRTAGEPSLRNGVLADNYTSSSDQKWYLKIVDYGEELEWNKFAASALQDPNGPGTAGVNVSYWEAYSKVFYIRNYSDNPADDIPTLCVRSLEGNDMTTQCLVEGIEELQVEFGIDTDVDGVANVYNPAPSSTDMANAVVARIYLLVRSIDSQSGHKDTKTYQLGQRTIAAPNDGYLRRVFSTTVGIRNATLPVS
jgi:Tfp pilus assembly protein PilW